MFSGIGVGEMVLVVLLLLLLFGAKRIPQIARGVGEGIRNFKTDVRDPERLEEGDAATGEDGDREG